MTADSMILRGFFAAEVKARARCLRETLQVESRGMSAEHRRGCSVLKAQPFSAP